MVRISRLARPFLLLIKWGETGTEIRFLQSPILISVVAQSDPQGGFRSISANVPASTVLRFPGPDDCKSGVVAMREGRMPKSFTRYFE